MEKAINASDSEDEAFESADEGDIDNRPSTQDGSDGAAQGTVSSSEEKLRDSKMEDIASDKEELNERNNTGKKDEGNAETWKDNSTKEESSVSAGDTADVSVAELRNENKEENSGNEPLSETKHIHVSEETNSDKNDSCMIANDSPNLISEPTEPSTERIHESIKDIESQSPVLQAMDRMAEASSTCASSEVAEPSSSSAGSSSWGWGGWGSMLSKATSSVSSMLETVENQLGIPSPTEMAKLAATSKSNPDNKPPKVEDSSSSTDIQSSESEARTESTEDKSEHQQSSGAGLSSWLSGIGMSHLSSVVQSTGKEIVTGGLDALEFVGKKTIDAISHGDPGFRRKRITLSQAIREAKEKAEQSSVHAADDQLNLNVFSVEFDKFQGLAHLEALEMISRESEQELEKLLNARSEESRRDSDELLAALKSIFQVNEDDEDDESENDNNMVENFDEIISEQVANLSLSVTPAKLISSFDLSKSKSEKQDNEDRLIDDFYSDTITCFAELTARSVEIFHKIGEFMLLPDVKGSLLAKTRGNALSKICSVLRASISALSNRFATILNEKKPDSDDSISKVITGIYLEASNSSSHITESFRLLSPILQLSAIKHSSLSP